MQTIITEYPQFFTATCHEWKMLLKPQKYKEIIMNSLKYLCDNNRIIVNAFVILDNHLHLIWQMKAGIKPENVQRDFLKFTAQKMQKDLKLYNPEYLNEFRVIAKDREFQFWKRNPLSIELRTDDVFLQKLNYIHENPVKAGLCKFAEDYYYSSAKFYESGDDDFGFLKHYNE